MVSMTAVVFGWQKYLENELDQLRVVNSGCGGYVGFRTSLGYVRNAVACRICLVPLLRWLYNPMNCAFDGVIAPYGKKITSIHDDGVLDRCGIYKSASWASDLQPSSAVLKQQGDGTIVLHWRISVLVVF